MKLYRHHSNDFQSKIANANAFLLDEERHFNGAVRYVDSNGEEVHMVYTLSKEELAKLKVVRKNEAGLYFYATSVAGAEFYQDENTSLFTYEVDGLNLLDFRKKEDRAKATEIAEVILEKRIEDARYNIDLWGEKIKETKKKKERTLYEKFLKEAQTELATITLEKVIDEAKEFNEQYIGDFQVGVILRQMLEKKGYDGVIFGGQDDERKEEVVLLKPAKKI